MNLKRLILYFNTVKYLTPKQVVFNIVRRLFRKNKFIEVKNVDSYKLNLTVPIKCFNKINSTSVCFLNESRSLDYISDWACKDEPKLWRYNLHYFDFLLDDGASEEAKDKLINDWIKISHSLQEDAGEPYPVSLRLVNWIKYIVVYKNNSVPDSWLQSLCQQAHILFNTIEYHILANHFLKNGKGLLFAGAFLDCSNFKKWFTKGKRILLQEADEQMLSDGGHYEKSPMYHAIIVEDYLDVINLIQSNDLAFSHDEIAFLNRKVIKALDYLSSIIMPDGEIPLFNDSAFNIAPHPDSIFEYAGQVLGYVRNSEQADGCIERLEDSGYFVIKDKQSMCIIDCGSVSPNYQPGHTHCDLLSYELTIGGCRVIVNSGLHDYENSDERLYCRSTRAHNTVEIDGKEQTEVWGQFRVARRAKVLSASLEQRLDDTCVFKGSYSPFWGGSENIVHSRVVNYKDKQWVFSDEITGNGVHTVSNFIHIHPDVDCVLENDECFLVKGADKLARITFSDSMNVCLEDGWYYPEFGLKRKNKVLWLSVVVPLPIKQWYVIEEI